MKNKLLAFISAAVIVASNQLFAACCAPCAPTCYSSNPCCPSNWYIAASGSVAWHNNHSFNDVDPVDGISTINTSRDYKIGGGAAASVGYIFDLCNCWALRLEGEVLWRRNSLKNFNETITIDGITTSTTFPASGHTQDIALMANLIADFPLYCDLAGYLGAGLGVSFNQLTLSSIDGVPVQSSKNSDELFAWQVLAGLAYNFCPNVALTAGYRLFATEKVTTPNFHLKSNKIPLTQSIDIGLRFRL